MGSPTSWRLVGDGGGTGAANMARDAAILDAVTRGAAPPTLRLYSWAPPCLSLGRHQGADAVDLDFCGAHGIDVVRRQTGGRAVLHHLELTYAVVAPLGAAPLPRHLQGAYRTVCGWLVRACRQLGIDAELTPGEVNLSLPGPRSTLPCFDLPAGGEVVVAGRKLIGSAARSRRGVLLQHGAILLGWDDRLQAGAMGVADPAALRRHVTTVSDQLGRTPDPGELERAVIDAVAAGLGDGPRPEPLTVGERAHADRVADSYVVQAASRPASSLSP